MPFQREAIHANGSGKSNLDNGGNLWVYSPTNGDSLATIEGANFFLPFQEALEVNDLILIAIGSSTLTHSAVSVSNATTLTIVSPLVGVSVDSLVDTPGPISLLSRLTEITTTGAQAYTLANGTPGQFKAVALVVDGGTATITGGTDVFIDGATTGNTIVMADVNDQFDLLFISSNKWMVQATNGVVVTTV